MVGYIAIYNIDQSMATLEVNANSNDFAIQTRLHKHVSIMLAPFVLSVILILAKSRTAKPNSASLIIGECHVIAWLQLGTAVVSRACMLSYFFLRVALINLGVAVKTSAELMTM